MTANPSINRSLDDKSFDRIDHALGRPLDPQGKTYRNRFVAGGADTDEMAPSIWWQEHPWPYEGRLFSVTKAGCAALAEHLRSIGDRHRLFIVSHEDADVEIAATSHGQARYAAWLLISDVRSDLTFGAFARASRVWRAR